MKCDPVERELAKRLRRRSLGAMLNKQRPLAASVSKAVFQQSASFKGRVSRALFSSWPVVAGRGDGYGTLRVRSGGRRSAPVERGSDSWRQARAEASTGLGYPVLARPRTPATRSCNVRSRY